MKVLLTKNAFDQNETWFLSKFHSTNMLELRGTLAPAVIIVSNKIQQCFFKKTFFLI